MEAIRPRPELNQRESHHLAQPQAGSLPAFLPTPFPVHLLPSSAPSTSDQRRNIYGNIVIIQQSCVQALSSLLPDHAEDNARSDAVEHQQLVAALTDLLEVCHELESLRPPTPQPPSPSQPIFSHAGIDNERSRATLIEHLSDLQFAAQHPGSKALAGSPTSSELHPAINVVREEFAWARVESLSHAVLQLVQTRGRGERSLQPTPDMDGTSLHDPFLSAEDQVDVDGIQPPSYTQHEDIAGEEADRISLPSYRGRSSLDQTRYPTEKEEKPLIEPSRSLPVSEEKMMRELDAVTDAIEQLYAIAPQMHDQRADMPLTRGTQRDKMAELDEIWDRIERAHGKRRMGSEGQRAVYEGSLDRRATRVSVRRRLWR